MTDEERRTYVERRSLWHKRFLSAMMSIGVAGVIWIVNTTVQTKEITAVISSQLNAAQIDRSRDASLVAGGFAQAAAERTRNMIRVDGLETRVYMLEGYHRVDPGKAGQYVRK